MSVRLGGILGWSILTSLAYHASYQASSEIAFLDSQLSHQFPTDRIIYRAALTTTFVVAATIIVLSLAPLPEVVDSGSDIEHHMVAYAALALPLVTVRARGAPWIFAAAVVLGGAIELVQPLFGRYAEWHDFFANLAGATIGILLGLCLGSLYRRYVATRR